MERKEGERVEDVLLRPARITAVTAWHLLSRLAGSPALLAYLAVGMIAAAVQDGLKGLEVTALNYLILGFFAVLIRTMTGARPAEPIPMRRPKAELGAGLALFALILFCDFLFFHLTRFPVLQPGFDRFVDRAYSVGYWISARGIPGWTADYLGNAVVSTAIELLSALLLFLVFGYGPRGMGLRPRYWKLTLALIACTVLFALPSGRNDPLLQQPLGKTLTLFLIQIFINGLPEELFFRGFLLPRLERVLNNPDYALILSSLLFNAAHIPVHIANGCGLGAALLAVLNLSFPSGLLWGYLYQRTRSIVPGTLFHTAYGILGGYLFSV